MSGLRRDRRGPEDAFTLLEILAVVAIFALIAGIAMPNFSALHSRNLKHQAMTLVSQLEVARMLQRRVVSEAVKGGVPTVESSMYKLFMTEFGKRVANVALDLMGPEGQPKPGEGGPIDGRFERSYRYTVVDSIGGGASEVQKNIIARRALGLPANF